MGRGYSVNNTKKHAIPDAFVILFVLLVLAWLFSYVIPSGSFSVNEDTGIVEPGSYSHVASPSLGIMDIFLAVQEGLIKSANLIFLVLIMGGAIAVMEKPGTINAGIRVLIDKTQNSKFKLIGAMTLIFGIIAAFGVNANVIVIPFIPMGIMLAKELKLDALTGVGIVYLGSFAGAAAAVFDPIILGVAQEIAGLPLFSGALFRLAIFVVLITATMIYIVRYVKKISSNPDKSLMGDERFSDQPVSDDSEEVLSFTKTHKILILFFFLCIGLFIYGSLSWEWGVNELAAVFIINAIGSAFIARINPNLMVKTFMSGAKNILYAALIIGLARAIIVLMENGLILDTLVHMIFVPLSHLTPALGAVAMFLFNLVFNIIVPSGSGQAAVVMPVMTPLADMLDLTRQTAVVAFKLGDGITNMITPISGVLMAVLAIGGVPYTKWVRFTLPLVGIWTIIGIFFVILAVGIGYGPF